MNILHIITKKSFVIYNTEKLPFNVVGMSDIMSYESTIYRYMNLDMVNRLKKVFKHNLEKAINGINLDLIICHHLYLITAFIRETVKVILVVGICHRTCLKQIKNHDLEKEYIKNNTSNLDMIFSLHDEQKKEIIDIFNIYENKVFLLGSGYDENIFFNK